MLTTPALIAATAMLALTATVEMKLPAKPLSSGTGACASAEQWVNDNIDHLPSTYDEFAKYQVAYRTKIYARLPLQTRAAFWRVHLDRFIATHQLTDDQADLIRTVRANVADFVKPDAYAMDTLVYARAQKVLGKQLAQDAFVNLVAMRPADLFTECSCSDVHGGCSAGYGCQKNSCTSVACGAFGTDTCDGTCEKPKF